jgi:hypothetical protein
MIGEEYTKEGKKKKNRRIKQNGKIIERNHTH